MAEYGTQSGKFHGLNHVFFETCCVSGPSCSVCCRLRFSACVEAAESRLVDDLMARLTRKCLGTGFFRPVLLLVFDQSRSEKNSNLV